MDPLSLFETWFAEAQSSEINDPNAMAVATADAEGQPSVRMVLLKGHDARGFVFYTNQHSDKGGDLAVNPKAALLFHWKSLRRQIRIEGAVTVVNEGEADAYFASRSRASQIAACASDQSRPMADRSEFEARVAAVEAQFDGKAVERPSHWSGYRVVPSRIEFWEDGAHRMHHRQVFIAQEGGWREEILFP